MLVLGIDPGSRTTGYGLVRIAPGRIEAVAFGILAGGEGDLSGRLLAIGRALGGILSRHRPDCIGLEQAFHARNVRSTLVLGHVRGMILWLAAEAGLTVHEYAPRSVKLSITGRGEASKLQVSDMVRRLLDLARPQVDEADSLAVALCCARRLGLENRIAVPLRSRAGIRTGRTSEGRVIDLARAFAPPRKGREARDWTALVERRAKRGRP